MYKRLQDLKTNESVFLFGPRGCGKSTLLQSLFTHEQAHFIDLLDDEQERRFSLNSNEQIADARAMKAEGIEKAVVCRVFKLSPEELNRVLSNPSGPE